MKIEQSLQQVEVLALELQEPLVVDLSTSVADVIRAMRERDLGYALITRHDRLVGIFTERDVLNAVLGNAETLPRAVGDLMTPDPVCITENDPVWEAVIRMHEGGYRHVPVLDRRNRVVGCVRHKDIGEYLANHFADLVLNLPPDPEQHAHAPDGG